MIQATIVPTFPLRATGSTVDQERIAPTRLRDGGSASATDPVVLIRGCTTIDLRVETNFSSPRVTWSLTGLQSNDPAHIPKLIPPQYSMFTRLTTDAVGLYCITATITPAVGSSVQYHWHVRFINLRVPDDPTNVNRGTLEIGPGQYLRTTIAAEASFGFNTEVVLSGAADATAQYNKVTVGILQNLFQKSTDPGCEMLHGIYYKTGDLNSLSRGKLIEPCPTAESPHLDADEAASEFPFMHDGHVTVKPTAGSVRSIKLWDAPGVMLPRHFDPNGGKSRKEWREKGFSEQSYTLCGVGGCLKFISAVAAFSTEAKYNYVVFEKYEFTMRVNSMLPEQVLTQYPPTEIPDKLPKDIACFEFDSYSWLITPADARDADMETYGPVATKGGSTYTWQVL